MDIDYNKLWELENNFERAVDRLEKAADKMQAAACMNTLTAMMEAENKERERKGLSPAYTEDEFEDLVKQYRIT